MATKYGPIREESADLGRTAYAALIKGGSAGFDATLGGNRASEDKSYARLEAHGIYWTASESSEANAWMYNFGRGGLSLGRHRDGDKRMALSVRCVRE